MLSEAKNLTGTDPADLILRKLRMTHFMLQRTDLFLRCVQHTTSENPGQQKNCPASVSRTDFQLFSFSDSVFIR